MSTLILIDPEHDLLPGMIWAFSGALGEQPVSLSSEDLRGALGRRNGWVWLHVDLLDRRSHDWVARLCALPEPARLILEGHDDNLALGHADGMVIGTGIDFHSELARGTDRVGRYAFAVNDRLLVTGRRHPLVSAEAVRHALEGSARPETAYDVLALLLAEFCRATGRLLGAASTSLDGVEDRLVTDHLMDDRRELKRIRRLVVSVHRPVAALASLCRDEDRSTWPLSEAGHATLRRLLARLEALDREITTVSERAKLLQEEVASELAEQSNRSLKALAIMSALLLPGTLIVGIFGMNTGGLPLTQDPAGFMIAIGLVVMATAMFYWVMLRAGADLKL